MHYVVHLPAPSDIVRWLDELRTRIKPHVNKVLKLEDHCTLAAGEFKEEDQPMIVNALRQISHKPVQVALSGEVELFHPNILVMLVKPAQELQKLHEAVLDKICPLRALSLYPPLPEEFKKDALKKKIYAKYGSPFVRQLYRPHVSVAAVHSMPSSSSRGLNKKANISWNASLFRLSKKVDNGYKLVKDYAL